MNNRNDILLEVSKRISREGKKLNNPMVMSGIEYSMIIIAQMIVESVFDDNGAICPECKDDE